MKRFLFVLTLCLMVLALNSLAFAAGNVVVNKSTTTTANNCVTAVEYRWTADSTDGSIPVTAGPNITGYVVLVVTEPGAVSPTVDYDVVLEDLNGVDLMGGALADRSASESEQAVPLFGSNAAPRWVSGPLVLKVSGNSVNSATGKVIVYVAE